MRYLSVFVIALLFISCSSETPEDVPKRVDQLIANDKYTQALTMLEDLNPNETDADISRLREKTHLNYGMYMMVRGPENSTMRDRMTSALEQFIATLNINPKNQQAKSQSKIMGIYNTMPDKSPGEEILADLRELGFNY
ncbi:MAG: hypothetical protein U5J63_04435 [Fodinibius sp.]|nr:hypothetical protein [Fodinibius sp.]